MYKELTATVNKQAALLRRQLNQQNLPGARYVAARLLNVIDAELAAREGNDGTTTEPPK